MPVEQHAPPAAGLTLARLRDRAHPHADRPGAYWPARENLPLLAQAVRGGRVHETRRAAGPAPLAVPAPHQPDGDAHGAANRPCLGTVRPAPPKTWGHL